jgi:hypothetical protein
MLRDRILKKLKAHTPNGLHPTSRRQKELAADGWFPIRESTLAANITRRDGKHYSRRAVITALQQLVDDGIIERQKVWKAYWYRATSPETSPDTSLETSPERVMSVSKDLATQTALETSLETSPDNRMVNCKEEPKGSSVKSEGTRVTSNHSSAAPALDEPTHPSVEEEDPAPEVPSPNWMPCPRHDQRIIELPPLVEPCIVVTPRPAPEALPHGWNWDDLSGYGGLLEKVAASRRR